MASGNGQPPLNQRGLLRMCKTKEKNEAFAKLLDAIDANAPEPHNALAITQALTNYLDKQVEWVVEILRKDK
jgi:hypothetical protein